MKQAAVKAAKASMPFALVPAANCAGDAIQMAARAAVVQVREKAVEVAQKKDRQARKVQHEAATTALKQHLIEQMDLNRFRVAFALGSKMELGTLTTILDDFTLALVAEEHDNSLDRTRRHILTHGFVALMRLADGATVGLAHTNGIQVAAELAMRLTPTYTDAAMIEASRALNRLWLERGVKGADPATPAPARSIAFRRAA